MSAPRSATSPRAHPRPRLPRRLGLFGLLLLIAVQPACFFSTTLDITVLGNTIIITGDSTVRICMQTSSDPDMFECTYFIEGAEGAEISTTTLTGLQLGALLLLIDPVVAQVPAAASNFSASYSMGGGATLPLVVNAGLSAVPADLNQTISAEAGTQLVTLELPPGAPTTGTFSKKPADESQ